MAWLETLFEQLPEIIAQAAASRLGLFALMIVALSLIGFFFFRHAETRVRVGIFVLLFVGVVLFGVQLFRTEPATPIIATDVPRTFVSEPSEILNEARALLDQADESRLSGRNDQARAAYTEARTLFKQVEDRLGEANVLRGLGHLERKFGRNDQARAAYTEARALYKQVEDRLGEANVLLGLGRLEAANDTELAKRHLHQAAQLYAQIGMPDWEQKALAAAAELSSP